MKIELKKARLNWKKLNLTLKAAIVTGCFSLVVAVCGIAGSITSALISRSEPKAPNNIRVLAITDFNWSRLFSEDDRFDKAYIGIVTDSCLKFSSETGTLLDVSPSPLPFLNGTLGILVMSEQPVVITEVEIEVLNYVPLDSQQEYPILYDLNGRGGGGGFVNQVEVDNVDILPTIRTYSIPKARLYELPDKGAVTFMVPITFKEPGVYSFRANVAINEFDSSSIVVNSDMRQIGWFFVSGLLPSDVEAIPGGIPDFVKKLHITSCQ